MDDEDSRAKSVRWTPVVWLMCAWSAAIFLSLRSQDGLSHEALREAGALSAAEVLGGAWWGLLTSAFVHYHPLHLLLNLHWIWTLGRAVEERVGSLHMAVLCLVSAVVASGAQLALVSELGIGISGVVCALFGFAWVGLRMRGEFEESIDGGTIRYFMGWLVACLFLTAYHILPIGNGAHFGGLALGAAWGWVTFRRSDRTGPPATDSP